MNISVIVATFGSDEWRDRGEATVDRVRANLEKYHSIVAHHHRGHSLAEARNSAAASASGDWLCFLDADDMLSIGYIEAMHTQMHFWNLWRPHDLVENPVLFAPAMRTVNDRGQSVGPFIEAQLPNRQGPMTELNHCVIGTLVPKFLFHQVGGFGDEPVYEDWALFLRCIRAGARIVDVPAAVYVATSMPDGRNRRDPLLNQRTYDMIRAEHERSS